MAKANSIPLHNNCLSLNPAGYHNTYGIVVNYPNKGLVIHYEIACAFVKRTFDTNGDITPPLNSGKGLGGFTPPSKNIVITGNADLTSSAHEILHALMLPHTWESKNHIKPGGRNTIQEPFAKHSFKFEQTYNVMDYGERNTQYFLYYWQCLVANAHAVAEPVNYTTVS